MNAPLAAAQRVEVRRLRAGELEALLDLYLHLHATDAPLPDDVERIWEQSLAHPGLSYIGAFIAHRLVASCMLVVVPNLTRGGRPWAVIENVVTAREHRRHGYGQAVLHRALAQAWHFCCYKVMLQTGPRDEATLCFYQKAGFLRDAQRGLVALPPD
ncbi:GNAT family N-acetyltransferase [Niveibacterium sp. SC-1]|uniref:GNAT family N-acetyltransferase n=1 Tax=Niveibacterium sp. SC-1 TaxID=3135646 RepID=UPI00311EA92A